MKKDSLNRFLLQHKHGIELGFNLARGLKEFATNKGYFSLVENGFSFIKSAYLDDVKYNSDLLSESNGWFRVKSKYDFFPFELFIPIIEKYPNDQSMKAMYEGGESIKIYNLPITEVAITRNYWGGPSIFFRKKKQLVPIKI